MALVNKIPCNGIKPLKSEVYKLAAELAEVENIKYFREAVNAALKSYGYTYYYNYYCDICYYYDFYNLTQAEKPLALLFLSAMYESIGE